MNKMHLNNIDLNLLIVLAALLDEGSVTAAAEAVGRSQSAVSHALRRLRALVGDPLFVRSPEGMLPTPGALAMEPLVREILEKAETLFRKDRPFDPTRDRRCFNIGFSDYTSFVFLPRLVAELERLAPGVELVVKNTSYTLGHTMVENDEAEIIVGNFPHPPNFIRERILYRENFVCVMRREHPAAKRKMTLDAYLKSKHILVSLQGRSMTSYLDRAIQKLGIVRKTQIVLGHFMLAPFILLENDAIATEPSRIMVPLSKVLGLHTCPPPFTIEPQPMKMSWHRRFDSDHGHRWMRNLIAGLLAE